MLADEIRNKLQSIVGGERQEGTVDACSAIRNVLCESFGTDPTVKSEFESRAILKEKQARFLKSHAERESIFFDALPSASQYLTEGGESKVYLAEDKRHVIKINDASYYATWMEYFNSLALHNTLFPNTAYSLLGFIEIEGKLMAVVQQLFAEGGHAELESIEEFLNFNGFTKTRRQDYYHKELGIILEDMHDENVIANGEVLFFIDTVFYIMENN